MVVCSKCGGKTVKNGTVKRILRTGYGDVEELSIQRVKCKVCGRVERVLPEEVERFKQYSRIVLEDARELSVDEMLDIYADSISEMSIKRWRTRK